MKAVRQLSGAVVLTLALSFTALAGNMDTPGVTQPPPPSDPLTGEVSVIGVTSSGTYSSEESGAVDSATEIALYLFGSIVSSAF